MAWNDTTKINADGLHVRFGTDEVDTAVGGEPREAGGDVVIELDIPYTELQNATDAIVGSVAAGNNGSFGVVVPKGLRIKAVEVLAETAFTSSGTIGSSTMLIGLKKADRTTELDHNGFTTASFVGSKFDAVGERTYVEIGTTGAGALIGTTLTESGIVTASNSAHSSHPYTAGVAKVKIIGYFP